MDDTGSNMLLREVCRNAGKSKFLLQQLNEPDVLIYTDWTVRVITRKMSEQIPADNPHGVDVRRVYDSEYALSSVITMKPGEKLIRHITPVDVFFYVLEGSGTVEVGEEKKTVSTDTVIESPAGIPHCWYNESTKDLRVLVVKVPRPTSKTQLL